MVRPAWPELHDDDAGFLPTLTTLAQQTSPAARSGRSPATIADRLHQLEAPARRDGRRYAPSLPINP